MLWFLLVLPIMKSLLILWRCESNSTIVAGRFSDPFLCIMGAAGATTKELMSLGKEEKEKDGQR